MSGQTFINKIGTLDVVSDREMLYKPGLYGWDMDTINFELKPEYYEMVPAFVPRGCVSIEGKFVRRIEFNRKIR